MPDGPNKNIPQPPVTDQSKPELKNLPSDLVIEAPEYLDFDQNLYGQQPFDLAIERAQGRLRLGQEYKDLLRKFLSVSLSNPNFSRPVYAWQAGMSTEQVTQAIVLIDLDTRRFFPYKRIVHNERPHAARIIAAEILGLLQYPFIGEYVADQISGGGYNSMGKVRGFPRDRNANPDGSGTKSYAKWLSDRVEREGRMLSLEVRSLIFGDEETAPSSAAHTSGHRRGWRRWAILKASEITR